MLTYQEAVDLAAGLELEVERLRELLHVVYSEALTLEEWREGLRTRLHARVELAVEESHIHLMKETRLDLVELLARQVAERLVQGVLGEVTGGASISRPFPMASMEGRAADTLYRGGKKGSDAE